MNFGDLPKVNVTYRKESGCKFGDKCTFMHMQVEDQTSEKPKKDGDKSAVAILNDARPSGCVFQDIEPPESSSILRKSTKIWRPIRRVLFLKSHIASRKHPRKQRSIAWSDSNQNFSSAQPVRSKIWGSVVGTD